MTVRVAVVGLGMALKPHLQSLRELSAEGRVAIAACYTPSSENRRAFSAANPDLALADDVDAILRDHSIDAVMLLTPPFTHLDLVEKSAVAGKHVLVEKPLDVTTERARRSVAAAERAGVRLGVVLQHRFRGAAGELAEVVASGALGALVSGSASIRWWRDDTYFAQPGRGMKERDGGGVLMTQAIHTLDLFQHLAGDITEVSAMAATSPLRRIDTEDVVAAAIRFANGAIGTIDATTVSYPGFPERIELACERGTAVLQAENLEVFYKAGRHVRREGSTAGGGGADPMAFSHEAHKALIGDFVEAVATGREPRVSGRDALKVHTLIDALLQSATERRPVVLA